MKDICRICDNPYDICKCAPFDDELDKYMAVLEDTEPLVEEDEVESEPWESTDAAHEKVRKGNEERLQEAIDSLVKKEEKKDAKLLTEVIKTKPLKLDQSTLEIEYELGYSDGYDTARHEFERTDLPEQEENKFALLGTECGKLVEQKQEAYGDSFGRSGNCLREMFPNGIMPEQYDDLLTIARMLDKLFRIANNPDAFDENPYRDCVGYSLLGMERYERKRGSE